MGGGYPCLPAGLPGQQGQLPEPSDSQTSELLPGNQPSSRFPFSQWKINFSGKIDIVLRNRIYKGAFWRMEDSQLEFQRRLSPSLLAVGLGRGKRAQSAKTRVPKRRARHPGGETKMPHASASLAYLRPDKSPGSLPAAICIRRESGDRSRCIHKGTLQIRLTKSRRWRQLLCCTVAC